MNTAVPTRRVLVLVWLVAAAAFGGLLAVARSLEGPLDDVDPALQRPGFLDAGPLPVPAVAAIEDVPASGRPAVVFFTRPDRLARLCHALSSSDIGDDADVIVIVSAPTAACAGGPAVIADRNGAISNGYGMRTPRGGGPPVGYAVVDADGMVRYRTLDATMDEELAEVGTIVDALP